MMVIDTYVVHFFFSFLIFGGRIFQKPVLFSVTVSVVQRKKILFIYLFIFSNLSSHYSPYTPCVCRKALPILVDLFILINMQLYSSIASGQLR